MYQIYIISFHTQLPTLKTYTFAHFIEVQKTHWYVASLDENLNYIHDFVFISNWLISNSTELFPKIKQLKNARYCKFDYPKQL